ARLRDANNQTYWAATSQQLLFDTTGWRLPLDGLNYWVLGLPVPDTPGTQALDRSGRLKSLDQLGWQVRFLRYRRHGVYEFPSKLFIRRQANGTDAQPPDEGDSHGPLLEVRLVIERWSPVP
ncbi:MAG: outer membrane lipoprotein LolB, partial [Nitrospiraceae bacterium]